MEKKKPVTQEKIYEVFGEWIHEMMAERGMTQREMAAKTGLTESTIQKYSQGRMLPTKSRRYAHSIAKTLGVDVSVVRAKIEEAKAASKGQKDQ